MTTMRVHCFRICEFGVTLPWVLVVLSPDSGLVQIFGRTDYGCFSGALLIEGTCDE
jgi:hypothetical protein